MSTGLSESVFILPDILADWPWKRKINPLSGLQTKTESTAWMKNANVLTPRLQRGAELTNTHLLASLAYPLENKDVFRVGCDLMNWFFLFDESTDVATPHEAQQMANIVMDAMRNPDKARPAGEWAMGEATRRFWKLTSKSGSIDTCRRLMESLDRFTAAVVQQAQDRAQNSYRNIDEYFSIRRETVGAWPSFVVCEFALNLPNEVFEDPIIQRLATVCADLIIVCNDISSYNVEQARGDDGHNLVTILMHHESLSLNEAMKWIGDYASKRVRDFKNDLSRVPSFGEEFQDDVKRYLDGLGNWVTANDCWDFECRRYFLTGGLEIQKSRKVVLLPRVGNPAK